MHFGWWPQRPKIMEYGHRSPRTPFSEKVDVFEWICRLLDQAIVSDALGAAGREFAAPFHLNHLCVTPDITSTRISRLLNLCRRL